MLETGLGGPNDYGTSCLSYNDDGSSVAIPLDDAFGPAGLRFFTATPHRTLFVNTNGNVSFTTDYGTYTPTAFPITAGPFEDDPPPMIAPYWTDVDIRGAGSGTACVHPDIGGDAWGLNTCRLAPGDTNGVYWQVQPGRLVVTWDRVGYYQCRDDLRMTFQLILSRPPDCSAEGDFDVEFRFTQCEWNTGNASNGTNGFSTMLATPCTVRSDCPTGNFRCEIPTGATAGNCWRGVPAQSGFDSGNGTDFVQVPGSRTSTIHTTMCGESNVGMPGVWKFQIREGSVVCPGAGVICDTGMPGVCNEGRNQCVGMGTACRPVVEASAERCDGLDNDCDGNVDDETPGTPICAAGARCDMGRCIDPCFDNACDTGYECERSSGLCVPEGCSDVECGMGERCMAGVCGGACAGITCPSGQDCREGRCLDLCDGLTCDDCSVCEHGSCEDRCPAVACGSGEECTPEGRCVPTGCAGMSCDTGFTCTAAGCVDSCMGAVCPLGEVCTLGACALPPPEPDAGMPDAGPVPDAGPPEDAFVPPIFADGGEICNRRCMMERELANRGCGCSVPTHSGSSSAMWLGLGALGFVLASRRRRS